MKVTALYNHWANAKSKELRVTLVCGPSMKYTSFHKVLTTRFDRLWQGPHPFMTGCDPKSARRQRAWDINQAIVALQNANVAEVSSNSIQKAHSPSSPSESRNDSEAQHRTETQS